MPSQLEIDEQWMRQALALADRAAEQGEVPVGALVVLNNTIIGSGWNQPITSIDPTAHAEVLALKQAAQYVGNYRLSNATLYVSLEPCAMCAGAIVHARIERLVYAAREPKAGAVVSQAEFFSSDFINHKVVVEGGILEERSRKKLQTFFKQRRDQQKRLKKRI